MKVLLINSVCGVGSTGRICTDLYEGLEKKGHKCCIAYGRGEALKQYHTYKIGHAFNNYNHVFETRFFDNHGFSSRNATKKLVKFIKDYDPDVINIHNVHGYFMNLEILCNYLSESKAKIIWTLHDGWLFSGHSAHPELDKEGVPVFQNHMWRGNTEYPKSYVSREKRNFYKKRDAILRIKSIQFITPSQWLEERAQKTYLRKYSIKVINNGIDLEKFFPDGGKEIPKKKIILGVASVWNESKGLHVFNELADRIDSTKYEILLVGSIKEKINKKIKIIHKTNSIDELRKIYSLATYFVNPTFNDTFPTVNIEALACGIPVITFKTGGSPEIISTKTGVTLRENSVESLNKIIESAPYFETRDCLQQAKKYDKRKKFEEYIQLIECMSVSNNKSTHE